MSFSELGEKVRNEFPLAQAVTYLDSAATSLKPQSVIDRLANFYRSENANVHRAAHRLSSKATENYELTRHKVKDFLNASSASEIVFTSGTTASLNLIANMLAKDVLKTGDEIIITEMEHHSNIVPWYMVAQHYGLTLKFCRITEVGEIDLDHLKELLGPKVRVLAISMVSNVLGTVNPIRKICQWAKEKNILTVIDAAQAVACMRVDVQELGCDFLAFSAHKMFGPFGVGVLYGRREKFENLRPFMGGGGMIEEVTKGKITYADLPTRLEAGTPNISGVIALGTAIDFIESLGFESIKKLENDLRIFLEQKLCEIPGFYIYGRSPTKVAIIAFNLQGVHASDVATIMDQMGVAVRAGHHCAQLLMQRYNTSAMVRASLSIYNTESDVEKFIQAAQKARELLL